jgi:Starch-binding associating with outer membrane
VSAMPATIDQPEDPTRTLRYCPSGSPPCYVGLFNALTQAEASPLVSYTSRPGAIFYAGVTAYGTFGGSGGSFPSFLMTAAEVEFIRAEAAERGLAGLTPAQAGGFYDAAITRSMEMWGISAPAIATYLANAGVSYAAAGSKVERLKRIAIQKWLALYIDSIQAWTEFRRTCQPDILKPGPTAVVAQIPRRLQYSTTDKAVNATNYAAAVARQGADNFLTHIYWDKNQTSAPTYVAGCGVQ